MEFVNEKDTCFFFSINTYKSLQKGSWLKYSVSGPGWEERGGGKRGTGMNNSPLSPTAGECPRPVLGC